MNEKLLKPYNPKETEARIYKQWEESGYFNPDKLPERHKEAFSMVLPPPNVTGILHMGSALMLAVQDIIIRFERMRGKKTLWIPGTDHASIATETRFIKEKKISKRDFAEKRDEFVELVNDYALSNQKVIIEQMRTMGASLDWSRVAYTLDNERKTAVTEAFIKMYESELIYMGKGKIVNWDVKGQTVVSDDEIEYESVKTPLYTFRYSKDFPLPISSTRPETKVGDTAVAVHPDDERYRQFIGKTFKINFVDTELNIKIIADPSVEPDFGTGALGVTPAHSKIDEDIASRHNLESVQIIDELGRMNEKAGSLKGKKILEAREIVVQYLKDNSLLEKEEVVDQNKPKAQRSGGIIEELPKRHQFFVNVNKPIKERGGKTLKELMRESVTSGKIKILPERFEKIYLNWIDNLRDWSISRQIWYGHQLPVWYKYPAPTDDSTDFFKVSKIKPEGSGWKQFEDTLDTWFSSGLWSFSTLGWPEKTEDFKNYHPTNVLETAYDILFFWVARMILMSQFLIGDVPFRTVYLHGLVRDEKNRKISKSLGNNIDPAEMIKQFGADAMRMAMVIGTSPGNDSKISTDKFKAYKHFANKIWNVSRFVLTNSEEIDYSNKVTLSTEDREYVEEFEKIIDDITDDMDNFKFYMAAEKLYHYFWHSFADIIIEKSKEKIWNGTAEEKASAQWTIFHILERSLRALHPFMPFVTEEIWSMVPIKNKKMIIVESWANKKYDHKI